MLKPWLLEVNHGPSFATESNLDHDVKFDLIKDTLNIIKFPKGRREAAASAKIA